MSLLLIKILHPQQPSSFYSQPTHPSHFTYHVSSPDNITSKFVAEVTKKTHEAGIRTNLRRKWESHAIDRRSKRFGISDICRRKISSSSNENGTTVRSTSVIALLRNSISTAMLPMKLQHFPETNMITNGYGNVTTDCGVDGPITCLNDGGKVENTTNPLLLKPFHPSMTTTCRLPNGTIAKSASTESLNETFEAVLESLRRSLKKHQPRNIPFGRTILTEGVSVAIRKFNPLHSYKKLSLKRFKDERNFVEQKLNTFIRISDLGLGRKFVKVSDLKCCKYFYESYILHECRLMSLQRPKKKPLHEYYNDDDVELEGYFLKISIFDHFR